MSISLFISRFLYRIRYQLVFGSITVALLVAYFTQFLPKTYTVDTTIYTGIVSSTTLTGDDAPSFQVVNNTYDNLINLLTSKTTLEKVSMKIFVMNMVHGDLQKDNTYITAKNYKKLLELVPDEIKALIDKTSEEKTLEKLTEYKTISTDNFFYKLLNWDHPHYSYKALKKAQIKRVGNSDIVEISYQSDDPGIATNTVKLLNKELLNSYNELRYRATNDAIAYFEEQVKKYRNTLKGQEISLSDYNIQNNIINYAEQTKATAISFADFENRYEAIQRELESSEKLLKELEKQMETRTKLFFSNKEFIEKLDKISSVNGKITEIETFSSEQSQKNNSNLHDFKNELKNTEKEIVNISNDMNIYKYSKEGVAIEDMVNQWLDALIRNTKAKAEIKILNERIKTYQKQYSTYSPVGTEIKSREREINVTERTYLEMVHALNLAYLRKKNIQLTTAGLDTITEATFPLYPNSSKRLLFIIAAFLGSLIFIISYNLLIELLDRTLRDSERAFRLTGLKVFGAFTGRGQLRFRGYSKTWARLSAKYACNKLQNYLKQNSATYINVLSIEKGEGKSFVIKYLSENWERFGLKVKILKAGEDFQINSTYLMATDFSNIFPEESEQYDIIFIEHPAAQLNTLSSTLLKTADVNLLIANAKRVWKKSDEEMVDHLKETVENAPLLLYLNNADRETVEDFTGELPPYHSQRSLAVRMMHMGITAKKNSVK